MKRSSKDLSRRQVEIPHFTKDVDEWHFKLFPEEYDNQYDSNSEAKERAAGKNPMSTDYIVRTDARRAELNFAPYMAVGSDLPNDTRDWVSRMVREGKHSQLLEIHKRLFVVPEQAHQNAEIESQAILKREVPPRARTTP